MTRVTDLDLERFLVDDLDDADRARVAAAIDSDPDLAAHVAARTSEQQAFFARRPLPPVVQAGAATDDDKAPLAVRLSAWARVLRGAFVAVPAAAIVAVLVVVSVGDVPGVGVGVRGEALSARLVVRREAQVFRHAGEPLRAGDAVRIEVDLAAPALCSVIGVDVKGAAVVHYDNIALRAGSGVFPDALVLDAAEGAEDLIVACDVGAVDVDAIVSGAAGSVDVDAVARRAPRAKLAVLSFVKEPAPH
jgi:hypothetical protein